MFNQIKYALHESKETNDIPLAWTSHKSTNNLRRGSSFVDMILEYPLFHLNISWWFRRLNRFDNNSTSNDIIITCSITSCGSSQLTHPNVLFKCLSMYGPFAGFFLFLLNSFRKKPTKNKLDENASHRCGLRSPRNLIKQYLRPLSNFRNIY